MQISSQESKRILSGRPRPKQAETDSQTVAELARKNGVAMDEVRRVAEMLLMAEDDPARERRVAAVEAKVQSGEYDVSSEDVIDMAQRRAIADRAADL